MVGYVDGHMDEYKDGFRVECMDECIDGCMDECMDGFWVEGVDECIDGRMVGV